MSILLLTGFILSLRHPGMQQYVGRLAAQYLSRELGAEITIESLYLKPFTSFQLEGLYVSDQQGDTLFHAPEAMAGLDLTRLVQRQISLEEVRLRDARLDLHIDAQGRSNLAFLIDYFTPSTQRDSTKRLRIDLKRAVLDQISFNFLDESPGATPHEPIEQGRPVINFDQLAISGFSGTFTGMDFSGGRSSLRISDLSLREKSGFLIQHMDAQVTVDPQLIELKNLELQTNNSHIRHYILLSFDDYSDFKDFIPRVHMQLELEDALVASSDIAFFAPDLYDILFDAQLSGSLIGTVPDIKGQNIRLKATPQTELQGALSIVGLPDIDQTIFDIQIDQLHSQIPDVEQLVIELSPRDTFDLPGFLNELGSLHFQGHYHGLYDDFQVTGQLNSDLGRLETDLGILLEDTGTRYQGEVRSEEFDLASLVGVSKLGRTGFSAYVDGIDFEPNNRELWVDTEVNYLDFNDYRYSNLSAQASLIHNELSGHASVRDPRLRMNLDGNSSIAPDSIVHELYADIFHADLHQLGFYQRDSIVLHSAHAYSSLRGSNLNDIQGQIELSELLFELREERHHLAQVHLTAEGDPTARSISLRSDALDADLKGQVDFKTLGTAFNSLAGQYLPFGAHSSAESESTIAAAPAPEQDFSLNIRTHHFTPVAAFLSPELMVSDSSTFQGRFHHGVAHRDSAAVFKLEIPRFRWGSTEVESLRIQQGATAVRAEMELWAQDVKLYGRQAVEQLHIQQSLSDDRLQYQIHMSDIEKENHANLSGQIHFLRDRQLHIYLDPSDILLYGSTWSVSESMAQIAGGRSEIRGLHFQNGTQRIRIDGLISPNPEERLHVAFDAFELSEIDPLILDSKLQIGGTLHGQANIQSLLDRPYAEAALSIEDARMDRVPMGRFTIHADYDQDLNRVNLAIDQNKENQQQLFIGGVYRLGQDEDNLELIARFDQTELDFLGVILKDLIRDVQGSITGQATIRGTPRKLLIDGSGNLANTGFTVNYLQTPYRANGPIRMENTVFILEELNLSDPQGHHARVQGKIDLNSPTNPAIDAQIDATNFLVLRTDVRDNPLYYGTAYGTGSFRFRGRPDAMNIQINARTEDQTVLNIPLNTTSTLGNYEFIRFTPLRPSSTGADTEAGPGSTETEDRIVPSGLSLSMDLQVTPGATTNIFTELGELSGRGEGQISLGITSQGDLEMFGDYLINSGKFTFSAQDFINKIFEIKQGGQIRWTGKPTEATINLTAFYEQRTSLSPLYNAAGRTANEQRVLTRAEMELSGNLMRPGINFGLDFPADPYVKDELQSYLSDVNNVNQQALSLIVRRSFIPGSTSDFSQELNSTLLSAGTELAFNQLNNLISQSLNLNFIDLNIRSLNDASASLRFFDDRLVFTGGITDLRDQRLNDLNVWSREGIATDAELLYLIRKDGRLILRGSNRLNTRHFLLNPTDEYISALGLIYRQEFDSLRDFFRRSKD